MNGPEDEATQATQAKPDANAPARIELPGVKISVVEGPGRGMEVVAARGSLRVGSAPDNDLVLPDATVSRRHLEVQLRAGMPLLRDLGSRNGTFVDGVRVVQAYLAPGSRVALGDTTLRVTPEDEPVVIPLSRRERFGGLIGASAAIREAFAILERAAPTTASILVEGETGTGKELAAEGVHEHSPRSDGPFVTFDCGAVSATLIESELFGHVRGAFTGAVTDRQGVFEAADGGTLFLDEIGELPLDLQPKLLRALERREVRRVGETRTRTVDVRVVAATNRDLAEEVNRGTFREDLYYRLAVVRVRLPPLRSRPEDIPLLVEHFVRRLGGEEAKPGTALVDALARRAWPGNVRELRNAVERALALLSSPVERKASAEEPAHPGSLLQLLMDEPLKEAQDRWVAHFERAYLREALRRSGGSVTEAARLAGVTRRHIQRMMKRHGYRDEEEQ